MFVVLCVFRFVPFTESKRPHENACYYSHMQTADGQDVHRTGSGKCLTGISIQMSSVAKEQSLQHTAFAKSETVEQRFNTVAQTMHGRHQSA